jgi:hypothetical protein
MLIVAGSADESNVDKNNPPKKFTPELLEGSASCLMIMCHANGEGADQILKSITSIVSLQKEFVVSSCWLQSSRWNNRDAQILAC